jgi:hypothetical protein
MAEGVRLAAAHGALAGIEQEITTVCSILLLLS